MNDRFDPDRARWGVNVDVVRLGLEPIELRLEVGPFAPPLPDHPTIEAVGESARDLLERLCATRGLDESRIIVTRCEPYAEYQLISPGGNLEQVQAIPLLTTGARETTLDWRWPWPISPEAAA